MKDLRIAGRRFLIAAVVAFAMSAPMVRAQSRMSDQDVERTMQNLKDDAKKFQSAFNPAVGKSTIRKTSQEKDAKALVKSFRQQTDSMLKIFKNSKKAETTLPSVLDSAQKIDKLLTGVPLRDDVTSAWTKVKSELDALAQAFNLPMPPR